MKESLLQDVSIADFTGRLPGPFATFILNDLGARVFKIENTDIDGDPFNQELYFKYAPNFRDWYQKLNRGKEIYQLSFNKNKEELLTYLTQADIILIPASRYFDRFLEEFDLDKKVIIKIAASSDKKEALHDLNIIAQTQIFKHHLQQSVLPPYLPFAGIEFGHAIAQRSIAGYVKLLKTKESVFSTVFLKEEILKEHQIFESEKTQDNKLFLHNGAFPCYSLYALKDSGSYVALAAIEEKYWQEFISVFSLKIAAHERFDTSGNVKTVLKKMFAEYTVNEIKNKITDKHFCLTIIK